MATPTAATEVLSDARARFAAQGTTIDLDTAVGKGALLDELHAVLGTAPKLNRADTGPADDSGNFTVTGTARWLHYDALHVKFTFFASNGKAGDALQCLIAVTDTVPRWNVASDFTDLPGYVDLSPQGVTQGLQPSFLTTIDFDQVAFSFSSYDFSAAATLTVSDPAPAAGLSFAGRVDAVAKVWDTVEQIAGKLGTMAVSGSVTNLADAPELAVRCTFTGATLTLSKEVALDLTALVIRSGLSAKTPVGPSLEVDARLKNPLHPLDLAVRFGVGSSTIGIEAAFEDGGVFSLNDLAGLLGLDAKGLGDALPVGAAFGQLGLSSLSIDATLSPASLDRVQLIVTTEHPWAIVDDRVTVTPMLLFEVDNRAGNTALELAGLWTLGKSRLEVYALIATGDVMARLAPGSTLDVDELFKTLLPDVTLPQIELVDLDVNLNYLTKSFSLSVEAAIDWTVPLGPVTLAIEDIRFAADYSGGKITHVGLAGRLALSQLQLVLSGDYVPDASTIRGEARTDGPLDIGTLIDDLQRELTGGATPPVDIPAGLVQLNIESAFIEYQQAGQVLALGADVTHVLQLGSTFSIDEFALELKFAEGTLQDAHVLTRLTVCGVELILQTTKQKTGWLFEGGTAIDQEIPLGELIADLAKKFGDFDPAPDALRHLTVSNLKLSFDTAGTTFTFGCLLKAPVGDKEQLDVDLEIALSREANGSFKADFSGFVTIAGTKFALLLEAIKSAGTDGGAPTSSSTVLAAVQPGQKLDVQALVAYVDADAGKQMPALTIGLANALLVYRKTDSAPATWLFGLALDVDADLSSLPLVGSVFGDRKLGGIKDIQVLYASTPVAATDVLTYNGLLAKAKANPPLPIAQGATGTTPVLQKGFNFAANLDLGGTPLQLGAGGSTAPPGPLPAPSAAQPPPPSGNASWFDVKKSIGPVTLVRVGVRYESGRVWLLLDADFIVAGLSLGLEGLALGMKLSDLEDIAVNLDGMSVEFESGPLTIAGGFLRVGGDYLGEAKVKAATFGLTAVGGYAPAEQSFFIFVRLDVPLGGPPFFFVTGIAGGFGVNRSLTIPPVDRLTTFALLPANNKFPTKLDTGDPGKSLAKTLESTAEYIEPRPGQNWAAAGIDFSSFEMVDSSALVTVAFGVEFGVALLGICRITVPKGDPEPIVYLEITLVAQLKPAQGVLAVDGRITPASYLFAQLCRITGGFAFYLWFAGDHEGDFVISVGGYHPRFKKPDHYPVVPRMQLVYQLGGLVIKGESYLALTPHMVMAGLQLDATWSSGDLKAWFSAGIDFLLGWRPFHYEADAYVHIGVSLDLDLLFTTVAITIHVGVDLSIWGPPFGGKATIDLDIISFTIHFGDEPRRETVDWPAFKASFLPAGADKAAVPPQPVRPMALAAAAPTGADGLLCTASIADGLVRDLKAKDSTEFFSWLVDANHFAIDSNTLIPAKQATYNAFDLQMPFTKAAGFKSPAKGAAPAPTYDEAIFPDGVTWADQVGVLPMGLTAEQFSTHHVVRISRVTRGADYTVAANYSDPVDDVAAGPVVKSAAAALWAPKDPGLNGKRLIAGTLTGLRVSPMPGRPDITLKADLWAMLFDQNQRVDCRADVPAADRKDPYAATADGPTLTFQLAGKTVTNRDYKLTALTDDAPAGARRDLVGSLNSLGFEFETDAIDVADLAEYPLWDWPMIRTLGEEVAPG